MTAVLEEGTELLGALERMIKKTAPDKDNMRQMIEEVVDERLPRVIECQSGDIQLGSIEEYTRPEFDEICMTVHAGIHTLLVGPAGAGKTHLASQVARALGLRYGFLPLTAGVSESRLVGRFVPIGENGRFEYVPAPFVDFYENGGLFLLDELDAADANVMLCLNAAMANGHMETPNPKKPVIERHPDFRLIASANTWGLGANRVYVGRNQLDAATLDRFCAGKFEIGYDEAFEKRIGEAQVVEWVHSLRRQIEMHSIRKVASTRLVIETTKAVRAGIRLASVQRRYFSDWSSNERSLVGA